MKHTEKKISLHRFVVRSLAISSSTLSFYDFIKGEYKAGGLLALGWLAIVIAEKRINSCEESINEN
tara:strand:- start:381 stop:578 length:198 start_codon:yes stop_codon:yes gene_type:complete